MRQLARVEVMFPNAAERKVDELLVFDARCVDVATRQELLRLLPQLVHLRRAWRARFQKRGCLCCRPADPTIPIAARLRSRGSSWLEVYEILGATAMTRAERKRFESAVRWKLAHMSAPTRKPSHRYGAGGLCDRCYLRIRKELSNVLREMHRGRDAAEETAALTRRFDVAQWLLSGDDEQPLVRKIEGDFDGSPNQSVFKRE